MAETKKLRRSVNDRKLAGVCGGIAKYFNVDSNIIRIIFIIVFLCGSIGIWVYLICWLVVPEEDLNNNNNDTHPIN